MEGMAFQQQDPPGSIRYEGTVTSWANSTAWGFINCPDLQPYYVKDIFFHQKDCGGATISKGQKVTFLLEEHKDTGKPQARSVQGTQDSPDPPGMVRHYGMVASFSPQSAWGFISCPELLVPSGKDVFFHIKDCGGVTIVEKGQQVSFLVDERSPPERPQARSIQVTPNPHRPFNPDARYRGTVTNFSQQTAWGFIACPDLAQLYGKDIFFHQKDCVGCPETWQVNNGALVTFTVDATTKPEKPQARNIRCDGGGGPQHRAAAPAEAAWGAWPGKGGAGPAAGVCGGGGGMAMMADPAWQAQAGWGGGCGAPAGASHQASFQQVPGTDGTMHSGQVQSYSSQAGWGFIECPSLGLPPGKGLFFHTKDFAGHPDVQPNKGDLVMFALGKGPSGRPQALHISCVGAAGADLGLRQDAPVTIPPPAGWSQPPQAQFALPVPSPCFPHSVLEGVGTGNIAPQDLQRAIAAALEGQAKRQRLV